MGVFDGSIAVVIGGGGGIGEACVRALTQAGAEVAVVDLDIAAACRVAEANGARGFAVDITDEHAVAACHARIEAELGSIDVLINSAGAFQTPAPPARLKMERWDTVVQVNLRGTYVACRTFGLSMAERGAGAIVNVGSVAGMRSVPLHAYGPAKAGVIALTETLAAEWGPAGVRVNCISPGYTMTPNLKQALEDGMRSADPIVRHSALGRLVEPDEVASAVLFMASPAASAITGINLPVDCGWLATGGWPTYGGLRDSMVP